jgi:hypothetical protein
MGSYNYLVDMRRCSFWGAGKMYDGLAYQNGLQAGLCGEPQEFRRFMKGKVHEDHWGPMYEWFRSGRESEDFQWWNDSGTLPWEMVDRPGIRLWTCIGSVMTGDLSCLQIGDATWSELKERAEIAGVYRYLPQTCVYAERLAQWVAFARDCGVVIENLPASG